MSTNDGVKSGVGATSEHYDDDYYAWQSRIGALSGELNSEKFSKYIKKSDRILDFGCGGGFLLEALDAASKVGVEINPAARKAANARGIETVPTIDEIPNESIDVVVSNHAIEHVESPMAIARSMRDKLKPNGLAVIVVPCERYDTEYYAGNIDMHLYTWSPVNIGNLFHCAGFQIIEVSRYTHRWPPFLMTIDRVFGRKICNFICHVYARMRPKLTQIRLVARKAA